MRELFGVMLAVIIGGIFLRTMMSTMFEFQIKSRDIASFAPLQQNAEQSCNRLNQLCSVVGVGGLGSAAIVTASTNQFKFLTKWNVISDTLGTTVDTVTVTIGSTYNQLGKEFSVRAKNQYVKDFRSILFLSDMIFTYYDASGAITTTAANVRSMRVDYTFEKPSALSGRTPVRTRVSQWIYFKNLWLPT